MVHRSHKRWVPSIDAGTVKRRGQFWNPWPDEKYSEAMDKIARDEKPFGVGSQRRTDLDIPGKALSKRGRPL